MMDDTLEKIKQQHFENYRKAIIETVKNNTNVLVDEDIMSLLKKPPLDSMDLIKSKCLDISKKNKLVLKVDKLDEMLVNYRSDLCNLCDYIKNTRIVDLENIINNISFEKETTIIKINKKDFNDINKKLKKYLKENIQLCVEKEIVNKVNIIFDKEVDDSKYNKFYSEIVKYVKGNYQKQLLENIDFKILVKDTILSNNIKEQGERHLFTLNNSRIFKSDE